MIIDQLFENNKKNLNEVDPRNFDSDEDFYAAQNAPAKPKHRGQQSPGVNPDDEDYFREIFRKKREAAKKAEQDKDQGVAEEQVYESFYKVGRMLSERKMSEKEILDVFAQAEAGMTNKDSGDNRTMLGRGKDTVGRGITSATDAIATVLRSIQNSTPVAGVDVAYDQATDALANAVGPNSKVMDSIKKYRLLAKEYPKTQLFVKTALIALAGLATGGAALPVIAGLTAAVDAAIKGEKLSSIIGKGAGAGLMGLGAEEVSSMLSGADSVAGQSQQFQLPDADAAMNSQADIAAAQDWVNADEAGKAEIEQTTSMSGAQLQDIAVGNDLKPGVSTADSLAPGEEIVPPGGATGAEGLPGQFAGGQYEVVKGDELGRIAQAMGVGAEDIKALNPQIEWNKALQPGMTLNLPPQGTGAGSVWDGYTGGVYGDKVAGNAGQAMSSNPSAASDYGMGSTPIDYTQAGPVSTDSLGQKLEYGIPVNEKGSFIPPNPNLPAEELATQTAAYNSWKADFMKRFPEATQGADGVMQGIKPGLAPMQILQKPTLPAEVQESVKFKTIPADQMIDQKLTVLTWALNESVNRKGQQSVHLTSKGVYTVFENVDRYRKAIVEYTQPGREQIPDLLRPDAPGAPVPQTAQPGIIGRGLNWLDKKAKGVGGALSNFGHQFTTGVTKEKLKMNWHQAGKPTDSDQLAAWLVTQKVPQEVVSGVFSKMGIPYTAPVSAAVPQAAQDAPAAATGKAQKQMAFYGTNPKTQKPWTYDELQAKATAGVTGLATADATAASSDTQPTTTASSDTQPTTTATDAAKFPGEDPTGPNYVGRREVARRQAARDAAANKTPVKPNFAQQGGGYAQVNQPASVKYTGMPIAKPTTKPTTAKLPAGGGAGVTGAYNAKTGAATLGGKTMTAMKDLPPHIQQQLASTVKEATRKVKPMLENATSADDTKRIKNCIDTEFAKLGVMTESIYAIRDKMLADVTHMVAIRRREHARKS